MNTRKRDRKYPFAEMVPGETCIIETPVSPRNFRCYLYQRSNSLSRRFLSHHMGDGKFIVKRIDGLPNEDEIAGNWWKSVEAAA